MSLRRNLLIHGLSLVVICCLCASGASAQNENENVGFRPNHVFESGQFGENIDILNGGVNLTVPIGQHYQVNSRLGTSLALSNNSKVWDTGYFRSSFVTNASEVIPNAEGPFGIGFAMHLGRILVDWHYNVGCDLTAHRSCYTGDWKWVSPDGTQHEIYNFGNLRNMPPDPGVAAPTAVNSDVPVFTRRATSDLSYVLVSGPGDQYCYGNKDDGTPETGCFRVETPDGLVYTLVKRVDCPEPAITTTTDGNATFQNMRGDNQSFCGWYTRLIEDAGVGQRQTDASGRTTVPYPNNVQVTYDTRGGFEHALAQALDSTGRAITFHNCAWTPAAQVVFDPNATDYCLPGSKDAPGSTYATTDPSAVATYAIDLPSNGSDETALHPEALATYRFMYRFDRIKKAHPDFEFAINCTVPDCVNGQLLTHDPVLELVRIDYPAYTRPGQSGAEEYSLYYDYLNAPDDPEIFSGNYGEVTCRTLPVLRKSGGSLRVSGSACGGGGEWARFDYVYDYYLYIAAVLSNGTATTKPCVPGDTCDGAPGTPGGGRLTPTGTTRHVRTKRLENPAGATLEPREWSYTRYGPTMTNPVEVVVTDPLGNDTIYRYLASSSSTDPGIGPAPQDGYAPEWNDGINYQIDTYAGTGASRKLLRSEIREYDADQDVVHFEQHSKSNVRPKRVVTSYLDDGGREQVVTRNGWDGFGHWRSETESGFDVRQPRTTHSEYSDASRCSVTTTLACDRGTSPSICPAGETCVANPDFYETDLLLMKEVSDGTRVLTRAESVYTSRGKLVKSIQRATPPATIGTPPPTEPTSQADWLRLTQRPGDVLTELAYSNASGNAILKTLSSGRAGDPSYSIKYTYAPALGGCAVADECGGYLATKVFLTAPNGPPASWKAIDRVRDANTGLIIATRDTAGVRTDYDYDALGRVGAIRPLGEQPTTVDYVSLVETTVTQGTRGSSDLDPAADFVFTRYLYDGLGRQVATQKRPADPGRGFACQKTQYDVMNNVVFQTEWKYASDCAALPVPPQEDCHAYGVVASQDPGTESDYRDPDSAACDPFGRARLQIAADADRSSGDKVVRTEYFGTSSRVTVNSVRAAGGASFPVITAYLKDALGRLVAVDESEGKRCSGSGSVCSADSDCVTGQTCVAADGGADAEYLYDAADHLTGVTLTDNLFDRQTRRFGYDGLGHQAWAENPENGTTTFLAYDALGSPLAVQDSRGNVQMFHYDYAGRPTDHGVVATGNGSETLLSRNVYDESTGGYFPLGKVTSIFSFDPSGAGVATERRTYSGLGGRIDSFSITFPEWGDANKESTFYDYSTRGELTAIRYPQESPSIHTTLLVNYAYINGHLLSATEGGVGTVLGRVAYNAAGGIETVDMPGGGRTLTTFDSRNRPSTITAGQWGGSAFTRTDYASGAYAYDGAGNIHQIGANRYGYDAADRLIAAHTEYEGTDFDESFTYDIYGNMVQRQLTTLSTTSTTETEDYTFGSPRTNQIALRQSTVGSSTPSAVPFRYDLDGNMVEGGRRWQPTPASTVEDVKAFEYDTLNRLLGIKQIGDTANHAAMSEVNSFAYDAAGNRLRKSDRGGRAHQYYVRDASGRVLSEFRSAGTTATREWAADYVYLGDRLLALKENLRPRAVTGLVARQTVSDQPGTWKIRIDWDANPESDVQSYKVYRFAPDLETTFTNIATVTGTTYSDPTYFDPGLLVRYQVTAVRPSDQESLYRPQVGLTTGEQNGPSAPSLSGSAGDGRVVLTWTPSTDLSSDILGYEVQRRTSPTGTPVVVTSPLVAGLSFVDPNLTNGVAYYYRVRAKDAAGHVGTLSCQPGPQCDLVLIPRDLAPPAIPKGLVAASACGGPGASNAITLTWEANPSIDGVVSYEVHRNTTPQFDTTTLIATSTGTSYSDNAALTAGTTYYYALRAVDSAAPANRSPFTPPVGAYVRDASLTPRVDVLTSSGDGSVGVHWQPSYNGGTPNPTPTKYLIYRKPSAVRSCAAYEQVGDAPYSYLGDFTDGSVANNAAYDYALTAIVGSRESGFSRAGLGVPLTRPKNIVQCATPDPWTITDNFDGQATIVSWTPPEAPFYQPLYASTADGTAGFLKGYHLYHHKVCGRPFYDPSSGQFIDFIDNSPLRIVVPKQNPAVPLASYLLDPYLLDSQDGTRYDLVDPRFPIFSTQTALEPPSTYSYANQQPFMDCGVNQDTNCVMPKAVYKVYANGTWMTVESDWPDYFDPLATDPDSRCWLNLKNPYDADMPSCSNPATNTNFVPPPRKITATGSGPGAITLDWVPPAIPAGKPRVAGYYLYARSYFDPTDRHSFRTPLPFAAVGPTTTSLTLTGLGTGARGYTRFSVATVDEEGHVSGAPGRACTLSGADCSSTGTCAQKYCKNTSVACSTDSDCSTYGVCTVSQNACDASTPCSQWACIGGTHAPCTRVARLDATYASNGNGTKSLAVNVGSSTLPGTTLIAFVITRGASTNLVQSVAQTGATWSKVDQFASASGISAEMWYAPNLNGAGSTATFTFVPTSLAVEILVARYTGILATGAFDKASHLTGTGTSPSTGTTTTTAQPDEVWIGGLGSATQGMYSNPTSGYNLITSAIGTGTTAGKYISGAIYEKFVTTQGTAGMSATLSSPGGLWIGIGAAFKSESQLTCGSRTSCAVQICQSDACSGDYCLDSIGRWCQSDPDTSCTTAADCPAYTSGHCNVTTTQACNPNAPACPAGQICIPGDRCQNVLNSALALPLVSEARPSPPGALKTILWTVNDRIVGRGRDGIKLGWVAGAQMSGSSTIQGYRVYRSTAPEGPYCALLDTGTRTLPLPAGVTVCTSDVSGRTVDADAYSTEYSTVHTAGTFTSQYYWDRTAASDRDYYYRVSQVELDGTQQETPFADTAQIAGRALGYDPDLLPPPQGFRAGASQIGNLADKESVSLRWCPAPAATDLPTITEYRIYRKSDQDSLWFMVARISPSCLLSGNRCEINSTNVCWALSGGYRSCSVIQPTTGCNDATGPRCGVVDHTFPCWPFHNDPPDLQAFFNWQYYVTSISQLGTDPPAESAPSNVNRAWLNYCGDARPAYPNDCPPSTCTWSERRDPDGNTDTGTHDLVCGDEDARLSLPASLPGMTLPDDVSGTVSHDAPASYSELAPHRIIGALPCDEGGGCHGGGGGGGGGSSYDPPARWLFYHLDHLGSVRVVLDANAAVVTKHHFLPFGDERPVQAEASLNNRAFTGHERDKESGLDYMRARYYGSSLGRFETPDPGKDTDLEEPQSWNKYIYVRNNPVLLTDPDGRKIKYDFRKADGTKDRAANKAARKNMKALAKSDPRMKQAIKNLKKSDTVHTITGLDPNVKNGEPATETTSSARTQPTDSTTHVDPFNPATVGGDSFSPLEQLGHEVSHMEDAATGTYNNSPNPNSQPPGLPNNEVKAVRLENQFRPAIGSSIRTTYGPYTVPDPTADPTDPWP